MLQLYNIHQTAYKQRMLLVITLQEAPMPFNILLLAQATKNNT